MSDTSYLDPTNESVTSLFQRGIQGEVVMLNLLKLRAVADYSEFPELAPATPISGREAYELYIQHTIPHLAESGGELLYLGEGGTYLIGPEGEGWDLAMLVRQQSVESFLAFAQNPAYMSGNGHRAAAVEDSRILPLATISTAIAEHIE